MKALRDTLFAPTPQALWNWGRLVVGAGFGLGLALVLYLVRAAPAALPYLPAVLVGGIIAWNLFQRPLLNLGVVLAGFVLVTAHTKGINVLEVFYGLYALGFLAHWFVTRLFFYRERIVDTPEAGALFVFLVCVSTVSIGLSLLYGAHPGLILSEWTALVMLGFFFPVREACVRYRHGAVVILVCLAWIGLFVAVRNGLEYRAGLNSAKYLFQILRGRVITNDNLLMAVSLFSLTFLVFAERWRHRLLLLVGFLLAFGSLLVTQSRALWVSFFFGAFMLLLFVRGRQRKRLVAFGLVGAGGLLGLGFLFIGDVLLVIIGGLIERAATLGAGTSDFSVQTRVVEASGAFAHIVQNPVLGHGLGVPFRFFDIENQVTVERTFIHNGYVSLWYRFGLWGPALFLFFWFRVLGRGLAVFRQSGAWSVLRLSGLAATVTLAAFLLSTNTSNPFFLKDTTLLFGVIAGLACGAYARARHTAGRPGEGRAASLPPP